MQKSLAKNVLYKITLNIFNVILPIIVGPYAYRTLKPESMGMVNSAETIFNYFFIFAVFGIYQYGLRETSLIKDDMKKVSRLFTSLFTIGLITSLLSLVAFLTFSYIGYGQDARFYVLVIFGFNFIANIFYVEWLNEAFENYDFITMKTIVVRLIYVVLLFTLVHSSHDYKQFTALLVISTFLNHSISFVYIKRKIKFDFSAITIIPHLKPLLLVVIFSNANILYTQLDRFLIDKYLGDKYVSFFVMGFQIMTIINTVIVSVIQVTIPRLSHLSGNEDERVYEALLNKISKLYFIILFPATIGMFLVADIGVVVYGGKDYTAAGSVLAVFAFYMATLGIESILANQIIYVKKKENVLVKLLFIGGFTNLALNILLIKFNLLTPESSILSTTIANILLIILQYAFIKKTLKVNYTLFDIEKLKYLLYSLPFIPISYVIRLYITNTIALFLSIVGVCSLAYFLILFIRKDEILFMVIDRLKLKFQKH
ncbi:oligosaccharide flippase family protein [Microbacteriaceae bacterium 4G12]